jgi:hypothetical protein
MTCLNYAGINLKNLITGFAQLLKLFTGDKLKFAVPSSNIRVLKHSMQ